MSLPLQFGVGAHPYLLISDHFARYFWAGSSCSFMFTAIKAGPRSAKRLKVHFEPEAWNLTV